jgi:hypothetical protein
MHIEQKTHKTIYSISLRIIATSEDQNLFNHP